MADGPHDQRLKQLSQDYVGRILSSARFKQASVAPAAQEQLVIIHGEKGTLQVSLDDPGGMRRQGGKSGGNLRLIAGTDDLWDGIDRSQDRQERFIDYYMSRPVGIRRLHRCHPL